MNTIAFDIEVAGMPWGDVDEGTQKYLLRRARSDQARDEVPGRMALYPGLGKVIAISLWSVEEDRGRLLLEGEPNPGGAWSTEDGAEILRGDEAQLLQAFWKIVAPGGSTKPPRLVTYNGRGFDGPILMVRSTQLGIPCARALVPGRYALKDHTDMMDVLSFQGSWRERYTLDYWCKRFGVESPKGDIDGSKVGEAYRAGRIEEIGAYCLRDARATAELFRLVGQGFGL